MTISAHFHRVKGMEPGATGDHSTTWLKIRGETGAETVTVFMPYKQAEMIADAFAEYENWESSQEGPTFDDALGMKCDAIARQEAARAMK